MKFNTPLTTPAEAEQFIRDLHAAGLLFHFDDGAADCLPNLTIEEHADIDARVEELFKLLDDPHELACELDGGDE